MFTFCLRYANIEHMTKKRITTSTMTLYDAAKVYLVCLKATRPSHTRYMADVRGVRHILTFYGYRFPLNEFTGKRYLQYADIYSPVDDDWVYRERGRAYLRFVYFMKKNNLIPAWTAPEK